MVPVEKRKILAVVNCKARKSKEKCTARKMYWPSKMFRTMVEAFDTIYPDFIILSAKYHVLYPNTVIQPYCISIDSHSFNKHKEYQLSNKEKKEWAEQVIQHSIWDMYSEIHLHISNPYWNLLKPYWQNNSKFIYIKQPRTPALVIQRYEEFLEKYNKNHSLDSESFQNFLKAIGRYEPSKYPEIRRQWLHPQFGEFFGYARELIKEFPEQNLDEGTLMRVDKKNEEGYHYNSVNHHKGWCIQKSVCERLNFDPIRKQWRLKNIM